MAFARVLRKAGLTKVELATLYGVSRQTIYEWAAGETPRAGGYTARMAESITEALVAALSSGKLPFAAMDKGRRRLVIASLARSLQNLKPAPVKG